MGLQGLQIALENSVQDRPEGTTTKSQHNSPESTTRHDMSTIVQPIKKMTNLIKARMPQHPFSEPEYTFPHSVCKRQPSPGSSPLKK